MTHPRSAVGRWLAQNDHLPAHVGGRRRRPTRACWPPAASWLVASDADRSVVPLAAGGARRRPGPRSPAAGPSRGARRPRDGSSTARWCGRLDDGNPGPARPAGGRAGTRAAAAGGLLVGVRRQGVERPAGASAGRRGIGDQPVQLAAGAGWTARPARVARVRHRSGRRRDGRGPRPGGPRASPATRSTRSSAPRATSTTVSHGVPRRAPAAAAV